MDTSTGNPSDALKPKRKENYARLDAREMPELLRRIEVYQGTSTTRLAMKLLALTSTRAAGPLYGRINQAASANRSSDVASWARVGTSLAMILAAFFSASFRS